ncbi:MAG TPA: non-ribosomal peptide synthase/polyketide synthase [Longimicrobium sp.]|nr:non-ribosomal peptide synthase/polyketide synthase [Longimicrobium sp.]
MTIDLAVTRDPSPELLREQAEYWRATLADAPEPLELPADRPRPARPDHAEALVPLVLGEAFVAVLEELKLRHGADISTVLLAGWAAVLGRLSGQTDLVIGTSLSSRGRWEVDGPTGFEGPLPVRVDLSGSPTAAELVGRVEARVRGALRNQDLSFQRVVELVRRDGAASATPLFRAAFAWEEAAVEPRRAAGLDLSLELREEGGRIVGGVAYATALFDRETVERYVGYLRRMLAGMAADEARPVDRLALLSTEERRRVTEEWNRTEAPYPGSYIHERFEAQAGRTPGRVAVVYEDRQLTYGELNERANRLAHHLREMGVGPDVRVGICVEREPELVVAVLGVLKAGGAFLPLDPSYPRERLLDMVEDCAPVAVLTRGALAGRLAGLGLPLVALDEDAGWWERQPATNPERGGLTPEHLTYVIYTSGSTGRPKGVEMTHRGASNLLHWYLGATRISERDAVLVVTSFSFHLTQRNLLAPLFVGGRVHLAREPFEPLRIASQIVASGITMMNLTPTGFQALVEADGGKAIGGLRIVVFGGEPLYPRQLARVPEPRPTFLNPYGATEATGITAHHFARADLASYPGRSMPPGRPIANAQIYVLDGAGEPVPVGVTGELYLGGAGVTRGYRGLPGQTAERFLPDPFGGAPGARLYRTGDLGRWLPDGTIEFMGRGDAQVKVRGFRIELGEIEARLAQHAAVHEVVVVARDGEVGDPRLVAYYVGDRADASALRAHLAERLPEYMVPAAFVHMDALPVNPNGKLDRKALPAPEYAAQDEAYVAPRTPVEEVLAGIWAEVLGLERVGVEEGFFERGGHSLLATRVVSRVRELFGVELPLRALFEGPTVAEMARAVEEMRRAGLPVLPPVVPAGRTGALPLSFAQERLWFLDRLEPGSATYNLPAAWRLGGALDRAALERALGEIVRRHEALRTTFAEVDGSPVQVIAPFGGFALPVEDLSALGEADREASARRRAGEEAARPFDLAAGPLFRAALLRLGGEDHVLLLSMHHVVSDGWSMGVFFRELSALYEAYRAGRESPLPELAVQYADYAVWQREQLAGEVLDRQLAYWREQLSGAPELLELPADHPRPPVQTYRGASVPVEFSPELLERLQALGRREGATLYMTLLGAFQVLLSKYGGSDDIVVGGPIAGRTRKEAEELIGFFINTLVLRTDLSGDPSFREALRRVREATLGAYAHQEVPFEKLVAELQPERSRSHAPLFQVMFVLQNAGGGRGGLPGLEVSDVGADQASARYDLTLELAVTPQGLRGGLIYSTDLFERGTIERMLGHLERVLEQVATDADVRLSRLELLSAEERGLVVDAWNRTAAEVPADRCIHELFEAWAERTPDATAVRFGDERLSYAELNARANRLAHELRARGVGPEVRVALCVERGPGMVAAVLAVLKAGGAYVPLDPSYPADRLRYMLADSAPSVVLTQGAVAEALADVLGGLGGGVPVLELDAAAPAWASRPDTNPVRGGVAPENPAYLIYTSGSTGRPKGVLVPHRGLCNVAAAQQRAFGVGPDDRVLQFASPSFDAAAFELVMALASGAALCVASRDELLPGPGLLALLRTHAVTTVTLPPSALAALPVEELPALRTITVAGEALPAELAARWGARHRLWNLYGPTEATIWSTAAECADPARKPDIGTPIANVRAYVADAALEPLPVGVPGELFVGGAGVARGYLGRPGLTAERFVPDPFGGEPGARLYRTGDRVRWLAGGRLDFIGRVDHQVKVRGFRIEPGEIEARLAEHPAVREAAVLAREDDPGEKRLVAYVAGGAGADELREHLRRSLPEDMVPSAFVFVDALPLTPNGKLDRKALPAPGGEAFARHGHEAPEGEVERALAGIWSEVLRVERVGRRDHFFDLGGHSLLAVQVISRVRQVLGLELEPGKVFERPVLKDLAEVLAASGRAGLPPVGRVDRGGRLPLSFAQQRLWFLERMGGLGSAYHAAQRLRLRGALDRAALARALDGIVARHEALRTTFTEVDGAPEQRIAPAEAGFHLVEHDLSGRPGEELERLMAEEARAPFDLRRGPLIRGRLVRLADDDHVLLLTMHHIVSDGWSMGVLYHELSALYAAHREGREARLAELPVQYADYAAWQRRWMEGDVLREQAEYWARTLAGTPRLLELPTDRPRPAEADHAGASFPLELDAELTAGLKALSRRHGATLHMALLAGLAAVLGRLSGQDEVVIGTPTAGRGRREIEGLIGFFVNTLALRVGLSDGPTVAGLLGRVKERALEAQRHQDIPFEQVVELVQPARSLSYTPLFQVLFALQNAPMGEALSLPGVEAGEVGGSSQVQAKFDLSLSLREAGGRITGIVTWATALFDRETVERWIGYLRRVLAEMAADDSRAVERLAMMPESERALVVEAWNRTGEPFTELVLIHRHFEAQAARAPGATALEFGGESLTYAELDARANRLAHRLVELGVRPEGRVALCMEPCSGAIAGLLGVMKAGAAYVPLDPAAPDERTAFMLAESGARIVLADAASAARPWAAGYHVLVAGGDLDAELERYPATPPAVEIGPRHLAYVLYTSGSTGVPKGVLVEHGGVCNTIATFSRLYENGPRSRVLLFAPLHFDASVLDVFTALANGGTLVAAPREETIPGQELTALLARKRITHAKFTPSALAATPWADLPELEVVILGGEICSAELVERWAPGRRFFNGWGPTEVSVRSTAVRATDGTRPPPIGRPLGNVTHYVLDPAGRPVPIGVPGEIYVGGAGVTRGYLGRPALTAERYVPDPFAKRPGARMYRTGDKVRWRADGMLDFVARMDGQVKVRGFRIELGEIEAVLRRHESVADCVVLAREEAGEPRLVAYVVGEARAEALRAQVRRSLPEYMVPAAFVFLDAFPLNPNGKLDRKALPAPEYGAAEESYVAPRTPAEEVLAGIWAELLGRERVGAEEGFFDLGGHSLLATRVTARVREVFGVELPLRAVFELPALSELAAEIERLRGTGAAAGEGAIAPAAREGDLPVTFAQERLWFVDALDPGSPAYAIPFSYHIAGRLNDHALRRTLAELVRRHETLRTTLPAVDGVPVQRIAPPPADFDLPVADLRHLPEGERQAEAGRLAAEAKRHRFDLARGPLFRASLVRVADDDHRLLLNLHHAIGDGWSLGVLREELSALYGAFSRGEPSPLPEPALQYADYAAWQRERLRGEVLDRQLGYWKERLAGAPALLELPTDRPRPPVESHRGALERLSVSPGLTAEVHALARREGATLFMVLLAALDVVLGRLAGQEDIVVGTPIAGRTRAETDQMVGLFLNSLALRTDLSGDPSFRELLGRVREATLGAYAHQELPFERVLEEVRPERSLAHAPVFQVMLNLANFQRGAFNADGLEVAEAEAGAGGEVSSKFDLTLYVRERDGGIHVNLVYAADLFDAPRMRSLLAQLEGVLRQAAAAPETRVGALSLATEAAHAVLPDPARPIEVEDWRGAVHETFAAHAAQRPDAPAISAAAGAWTYAELDAAANRIAHRLIDCGVRPGHVVAVYAHRSAPLVRALLGTWKAGAAFAILDPAYPPARLAAQVRGSKPHVILLAAAAGDVPGDVIEALGESVKGAILLGAKSDDPDGIKRFPTTAPAVTVGPDDLAYVAFTSGTTGTPKAIAGTHRPLAHFFGWYAREFGIGAADRVSVLAGLAHDPLLRDVFTALTVGGSIAIPDPDQVGTPGWLAGWMRDEGITVAHLTPAMGQILATGSGDSTLSALRLACFGGDVLRVADVERLRALAPNAEAVNFYGATETPQAMGCFRLPVDLTAMGTAVPVGRGIEGVDLLVITPSGTLAGIGELGEIAVRTPYLARGYLNDAELTAARFVPNPLTGDLADRVYRTGDLGRYRPDGAVEPAGRADGQVKVRGFRVELGEIEAALARHPSVGEAVVAARGDDSHRTLVAYAVPREGAGIEAEALRAHLKSILPDYMVPAAFVAIAAVPLTANGKVDRRALPEPAPAATDSRRAAPRTPTQGILAQLWAEVLRVDTVGVDDDFFALGGHSLLATRLLARVQNALGVTVPLRALFEGPTVAQLAARVDALRRAGLPVLPPVVRVDRNRPLPLSFAQERLWFIDRLEGGSAPYNIPAALRLGGALDVDALERSLGEIVRRHESLRTTFREGDGGAVQVIAPFAGFTLPVDDLSGLPEAERETEVRRRAREDAARAFDLAEGPLFRAALLRIADEEHVLLLCIHHIVSDGWSTGVLRRELSALYAAYREGSDSPLAELTVQYADHAVWQREQLRGEALDRQLAYWKERLEGAPALLELPTDRPRPPVQSHRGARELFDLPRALLDRLQALGRGEGATLYMVMLGAFQLLLSKYSGSEDVVVGSPIAGRTRREVEELIGFFANTLVLRTDLSGDPSFRELLGRVREGTLGAYEHQEVPFERLVAELQPERSLSHAPLFQVMFALQNADRSGSGLAGLRLDGVSAEVETTRFDLGLTVVPHDDGIRGALEYSTALFDRSTVRRMLGHLERVLEQIAADVDVRLSRLELLSAEERGLVVDAWNHTEREAYDPPAHALFAEWARRAPEAVALLDGREAVTYGALERRAAALARHLRALGVGPETPVGLCMERTPELLIGVLGIWKAGGAYVPLDPSYPAERLGWIIADAALPVVVATADTAGVLPEHGAIVVRVDQLPQTAEALPEAPASGAGLAYVIYTSGSTGRPKGVLVQHGSLSNLLAATREAFGVGEGDVMPALASYAFDIWLFEALLPLTSGAAVRLVDRERVLDVPALVEEIADSTLVHAVPALMRQLAHVEAETPRLARLRRAFVGGDRVAADLLAEMREAFPGAESHVLYGPTEGTILASTHPVPEDGLVYGHPIGRPLGNVRLYVCDGPWSPQPAGVPGELLIGGAGVARGYLGRAGLTAERFVPDPFGAEPGARLYRTGDRARWRSDGTLEFLGRLDFQVKVRGFRIELGEIEARLREHPAVREAIVLVREDAPGDTRLVAYVVADESVSVDVLRASLGQALPAYMVPAAFVVLERLPLTPNGKLDRKALPAPEYVSAEEKYVAPRNPVEEVLAGIWAEVLRLERVGVEESFFELGGHSLLATRVVSRIRELFGVELPLRALFEGPTVAELAQAVDDERRRELPALPPVVPVERDGSPLPLSFAQERLWFIDRLEPGSATYNVPGAWRLAGALDERALERALGEIVRRHETLRTTFGEVDGSPVQVIAPFVAFSLPVEDLSALSEADREAAVRSRAGEEARQPFDLAAGPLFRAALLRLGAEDHVLLLGMHHVVSDGWSMGVLFRELSALYEAYREGRESPLAELPVQYADYAVWQREQLAGEVLDRQLAYWKERLAGAPALLELPADHPRPPVQSHRGARERFELPHALLDRLQALGRGEGATLYMVLLSAFQLLLSKYSGSDDIVVGSPIAGRTRREVEELIGFFANTLVLRTDLAGDPTFRELLGRVREGTLGAYEHQEVPFERLVAELQPERSLSHAPLFQVLFTLQDAEGRGGALAGLEVSGAGAELESAKFDLSLTLTASAQGLRGVLGYSTDLFERGTAERMLGHLARVLEQVAADADVRLSRLELLGPAERSLVLEAWNGTDAPYPADACLHELVEAQAERRPHATALVFEGEPLTYAELNARANRLAHHLRSLGVGPDARVGLCLERSLEMMVGLLAVLKAGGAYVPLDPAYPEERLAYMLADSGPAVVLSQRGLRDRILSTDAPVLELDEAAPAWGHRPVTNPERGTLTPEHLAYVIYTSGSTGRPKGVGVPHRAVVNALSWMQDLSGLSADDAVLHKTPYSFDASLRELLPPLLVGGRLVLARPEGHRDPGYLLALMRREGITTLHAVPSLLQALVDEGGLAACDALRTVMCGGEALPAELARRFAGQAPWARLYNVYGPTEAAVDVTAWLCTGRTDAAAVTPIGSPMANVRIYLLDPAGEPVPVGVAGELHIGGVQVARGYLGRPALTAERFVPDPFAARPGSRLYRTSDRARWRADGAIEYLGRFDHQVKVRGFRIELGEIEGVLRRSEGVADCVVVVREDEPGEKRLVAYVVGGAEAGVLREHLRRELPEYMVPSAFVVLAALPQTPNGKLDRKALPAPEGDAYARGSYEAPLGEVEAALAEIWGEVLGVERVGRWDHFFELGGHSLLAVKLIERMRRRGLYVEVRALFTTPVLAELALAVGRASLEVEVPANGIPEGCGFITPEMLPLVELSQAEIEGIVAEVPGGAANVRDIYPLAPLQEGFLFHHLLSEEGDPYLLSSATEFDTRAGLEQYLAALQAVIDRHDILRTSVAWEGLREPVQVVWRHAPLPVEEVELDAEAGDTAGQLWRRYDPRRYRMDLARAPLLRACIAEDRASGRWLLLLLTHHVTSDHESLEVLREEIWAHVRGLESELPAPLPFRNYVAQARLGVSRDEHERFFSGMLGDVEEPTAPYGLLDVRGEGHGIAEARLPVASDVAVRLRRRARALGVSAASLCHLAWAQVLARLSGRADVVFGTLLFGRMQGGEGTDRVMGPLINTLPVRIGVGEEGVEAAVRRTHALLADLLRHEHASLALAQRGSGVAAPAPLFTSLLNYRYVGGSGRSSGAGEPGEGVRGIRVQERTNYPVALAVNDRGEAFSLTAQVAAPASAERVCRMMHTALERLVEALEASPGRPVGSIDVLPEAERRIVVEDWNRTETEVPAGALVHELFEARAARTPGAVAVAFEGAALTFDELNRSANRLAHHLRGLGVGPDARVGICVERGPEMIAGLLAILKAGGAYVPLDPAYPADRLRYMLEDSAPAALVTQSSLAGTFAGLGVPSVELDAPSPAWAQGPETNPARAGLTAGHLAYVIYTSGSTGRPKGVMAEHRGLANHTAWQAAAFGIGAHDTVLQRTSISFDASVWELWTPLATGARMLLLSSDAARDPGAIARVIGEGGVTVAQFVPTLLQAVLGARPAGAPLPCRILFCGGEPLPAALVEEARAAGAGEVVNLYGPTEATIDSTSHLCAPDGRAPAIGRPVANARIYVLGARGEPAPVGVAGELYVAGAGVARGYLGRAGLTAERFVPDPFSLDGGARMYRTGDLGRWRADGTLEFLGRTDFQVKIRGFRIEPGEIEAALLEHEGVRECAVVARGDAGEQRVVAYVVGHVEADVLRAHLRRSLPEHMVPSAFVALDALPLTPNGKLDRKALPAPELAPAEAKYVAPRTPVEEVLAEIWAEVLGLERVGVHDSFFDLGGHSLLIIRLLADIRATFGLDVSIRTVFSMPTLEAMAGEIERRIYEDVSTLSEFEAEQLAGSHPVAGV